ncbi:MAG: hypothetical protein IJY16_08530 [Clostridia bacterium]|nr:hypothetical protein [Clostridia bacterium]
MEDKELQELPAQEDAAAAPVPQRDRLYRRLIIARYLLPPLTGLVVLVMSFFYTVRAAQGGVAIWVSHARLCFNSLKSARAYLIGGNVEAGERNFYVMLAVGAGVAILVFLIAAVLSCFAAYQAILAIRAGDSEEGKRRRILLKVLFPNRICYFLTSCLYLAPALFPEYFSAVCGRFLQISGGSAALFVEYNVLLIVLAVLLAATLVLSVLVRRHEDRLSMNAFL